jgi:choline dehydrogenase-like flavoprotein
MLTDLDELDGNPIIETDLCIIGAGAAGISIARSFLGTSLQICLLESGGLDFESDSQSLYDGDCVGLPMILMDQQRVFSWDAGRLRFFGGTTNGWTGLCAPLDESDFQARSWIQSSGWPITRADLDPWYEKAYEVLWLDRSLYGEEFFEAIGTSIPAFRREMINVHAWQYAWVGSFSAAYLEDLRTSENVLILLHANATNIQTDGLASAAESVDVRSLAGKHAQIRARAFVLACGGIENARLLLLSNQVDPNGLGNRHDLVGRFYMDHPRSRIGVLSISDSAAFDTVLDYHWLGGSDRSILGLGLSYDVQQRHRVANCVTYLREPPMPSYWPRPSEIAASENERLVYLFADVEQVPNPDSRVTLSPHHDLLGLQRARIDWRLTDLERRTLDVASQIVGSELERLRAARVRPEEWLRNSTSSWSDNLTDIFHQMGTTRMANHDTLGVVDANCRIHGMSNLYVAGSSVFPTSGHANPTLTIIALALRLADHLGTILSGQRQIVVEHTP